MREVLRVAGVIELWNRMMFPIRHPRWWWFVQRLRMHHAFGFAMPRSPGGKGHNGPRPDRLAA